MATFTQIFYHIVFSTKERQSVLTGERRDGLFRYIGGIVRNQKGVLYAINGPADHLHLLLDLHPTICLSNLMKDIKIASGKWIKENHAFPNFDYWQEGYGAFTHSARDKQHLEQYIASQQEHHQRVSFLDELQMLLIEAGIEFEEKYLV